MPRKANFKDLINGSVAACGGVAERQHPLQAAGHGQASRHHRRSSAARAAVELNDLEVALENGAPIVRGATVRIDPEAAE